MISKTMRNILHALSYGNIEVESSRRLVDIKKLDAIRIFLKTVDEKVYNGDYEVPVRLYFPSEEAMKAETEEKESLPGAVVFPRRRLGDRKRRNLQPGVRQNGPIHRTHRGFCGIPAGSGIPVPGGLRGLLRSVQSPV